MTKEHEVGRVKLTKAQVACLTDALRGHVSSPVTGGFRMRGGEIGKTPGVHALVTLRSLSRRGFLAPIDIDTRRITDAGRSALQSHGGRE